MDLENRQCHGCVKKFKVLVTSKQRYHSDDCRVMNEGSSLEDRKLKVPTKSESEYISTGKRPNDGKNLTRFKDEPKSHEENLAMRLALRQKLSKSFTSVGFVRQRSKEKYERNCLKPGWKEEQNRKRRERYWTHDKPFAAERKANWVAKNRERINDYRRNYYERNKSELRKTIYEGRRRRDPTYGLATLLRDFEKGRIGFDEFDRRIDQAIAASDASDSQTPRRQPGTSTKRSRCVQRDQGSEQHNWSDESKSGSNEAGEIDPKG